MKGFKKWVGQYLIVLLLLLVLSASGTLVWLKHLNGKIVEKAPMYHFYFIAQSSVDPFWQQIEAGAKQAAKDYNVYLEYVAPRFSDPELAYKYLDIATLANTDGIVTYVPNDPKYSALINTADKNNIPVITVDSDASSSRRLAYVGANSYTFGKEAAKLMIEATKGKAKIAIISNETLLEDALEYDLKMNGFVSELKMYPNIEIVKTYTSKLGVISSEEIVQEIISNEPDINAIFTLSASDTLGCARLIVDRNLVGKMTLVGTGRSDKILDYIDKGIIHSTIESDGYSIGYMSVEALVDVKDKKHTPTYIHTQINIQRKED